MWFNLAISFLFLLFFRGWGTLAAVISVATIVSYLTGPVSAAALRLTAPDVVRPFRVPFLTGVSGVAFVSATELLYWAKWPLTGEIVLLMLVALPVYLYAQTKRGWADFNRQFRASAWLVCFFPTVAFVSWIGSSRFGGLDYLRWGWDLLLVAVLGVAFFVWGVRSTTAWSVSGEQQELLRPA
jgi:amino acid transporter